MNNELKQRLSLLVSHLKHFNLIKSRIPGLENVLAVNHLSSGYIRIVRENKSVPHYFGLLLAQENDWVYISKPNVAGCVRLRVTADCSLDILSLEDAHFPIVSSSIGIKDLMYIDELECKHMLVRALSINAVAVENALGVYLDDLEREKKEHPEEAYQISFGSYARLVIAAFRKLNIAHLLYESEPLAIDDVVATGSTSSVVSTLVELIQNKDFTVIYQPVVGGSTVVVITA